VRRAFECAAVFFALLAGFTPSASGNEPAKPIARRYAIAIHGGAGTDPGKMTETEVAAVEGSLKKALEIGIAELDQGGASLDAVEKVIRFLEDDPLFNAGKGAVFNADGKHELDASIMDGRTKACGAVASVRTVKNPISLARLVMTKTRHVLLVADGAEKFAGEMKVDRVDQQYYFTQKAHDEWQKKRATDKSPKPDDVPKGTVGCAALDSHGNLAAGTSTGGLTNKKAGRVGDSPLIGAGTYADNATCAVSCTGTGEEYIRNAVAYDISARLAYRGDTLQDAVHAILTTRLKKGDGGIIAVDRLGNITMQNNTSGLARAAADSSGYKEVKLGNE
jgi:L-asparaginase / beta-aspartyl-peptidase